VPYRQAQAMLAAGGAANLGGLYEVLDGTSKWCRPLSSYCCPQLLNSLSCFSRPPLQLTYGPFYVFCGKSLAAVGVRPRRARLKYVASCPVHAAFWRGGSLARCGWLAHPFSAPSDLFVYYFPVPFAHVSHLLCFLPLLHVSARPSATGEHEGHCA
jgi:hypothetical protein